MEIPALRVFLFFPLLLVKHKKRTYWFYVHLIYETIKLFIVFLFLFVVVVVLVFLLAPVRFVEILYTFFLFYESTFLICYVQVADVESWGRELQYIKKKKKPQRNAKGTRRDKNDHVYQEQITWKVIRLYGLVVFPFFFQRHIDDMSCFLRASWVS